MTFSTLLGVGMTKSKGKASEPQRDQSRLSSIMGSFNAAQSTPDLRNDIQNDVSAPPEPELSENVVEDSPEHTTAAATKSPKKVRFEDSPIDMDTGKPHTLSTRPHQEWVMMQSIKSVENDLKRVWWFNKHSYSTRLALEEELRQYRMGLELYSHR